MQVCEGRDCGRLGSAGNTKRKLYRVRYRVIVDKYDPIPCFRLEDDSTDNLDKVWCFLENICDPLEPKSRCYSDTRWSERDGRF